MSRVNYVQFQLRKYQLSYDSDSQAQLCQFQLCKYQLCARRVGNDNDWDCKHAISAFALASTTVGGCCRT